MAQYAKAVLTDDGAMLLAKSLAGQCKIEFVCMATGNGEYAENEKTEEALEKISGLKSQKQRFNFASIKAYNDNAVILSANITNEEIPGEGYYIQEIGLYAREAGIEGTEVLYSIVLAETADYLPPYNGYSPAVIIQRYSVAVGNAEEVSITESSYELDVLIGHIDNEENPHKVTAEQLGLENVDNTADKDKSVKYAESAGSATNDSNGKKIADTYLPLGGGTLKGELVETKGHKVHYVNVSGGQAGYAGIAKFTITGQYQDQPIELKIINRGQKTPTVLSIRFSTTVEKDPGLAAFNCMGTMNNVYMHKADTSVWILYVKKTAWDAIDVMDISKGSYNNKTAIEWLEEFVEELPDGAVQAEWGYTVGNSKTADIAEKATTADSAEKDVDGNDIAATYSPKANPVFTGSISLGRKSDSDIGNFSTAIGQGSTASGESSLAGGNWSTATGMSAIALGQKCSAINSSTFACGFNTTASGVGATAGGYANVASGQASHADGRGMTALTHQFSIGHYGNVATATENSEYGVSTGTAFCIGNGHLAANPSNAFRITGEGKIYATNATVNTGADYAEYFEWADGNPDAEDRVGYFVTFDEETPEKIRIANETDYILGIVSGMPSVIGNGDECWKQRYILDDFGRYIVETFNYEDENENGEKVTKVVSKWKENPEYNQEEIYIPRDQRKEWSAIGMFGVLSVWDNGTCQVNGFCKCADKGIAVPADKNEAGAYKVIKRVNENIIKIVLR